MEKKIMTSNKKTAKIAGLLYFLFLIIGIFSFFYVPSLILVEGNAALTAKNIVTFELLFRSLLYLCN
ncbi:DUF4386 domain-containing protein [Patescibacteria group bacterium]|nr:DUF4386 domain-containing protein [Patescibacteria group bacterium]